MGSGTTSTIFWYIKLSYWCRALTKNLYIALPVRPFEIELEKAEGLN